MSCKKKFSEWWKHILLVFYLIAGLFVPVYFRMSETLYSAILATVVSTSIAALFELERTRVEKIKNDKEKLRVRKYVVVVLGAICEQLKRQVRTLKEEMPNWKIEGEGINQFPVESSSHADLIKETLKSESRYFDTEEISELIVWMDGFRNGQRALKQRTREVLSIEDEKTLEKYKSEINGFCGQVNKQEEKIREIQKSISENFCSKNAKDGV
jgi:hypothetical protein